MEKSLASYVYILADKRPKLDYVISKSPGLTPTQLVGDFLATKPFTDKDGSLNMYSPGDKLYACVIGFENESAKTTFLENLKIALPDAMIKDEQLDLLPPK